MLILGIDLGTSSIKVSVMHAEDQKVIASAQYPEIESSIISHQKGWAEQSPNIWWDDLQFAIKKVNTSGLYDPKAIAAIGIAYQMHGLVLINKNGEV